MNDVFPFFADTNRVYSLVSYLLGSIVFFLLARKGGFRHAWVAFVPVASYLIVLHLAGKPLRHIGWFVGFYALVGVGLATGSVVGLAPVLFMGGLALSIALLMLYYEILHNFGMSGWWLLPLCTPLSVFVFLYMVFSKDIVFRGPSPGYDLSS